MNGRIGYEAYKTSTGGKTFDGRDMPTWEQIQERTPHVAKAWDDAAEAVRFDWPTAAPAKFSFGEALALMKLGKRVARDGWNGKGMWIALTPGGPIDVHCVQAVLLPGALGMAAHEARNNHAEHKGALNLMARIDMRAADGSLVIGWLASQTDMLAEDWVLVE